MKYGQLLQIAVLASVIVGTQAFAGEQNFIIGGTTVQVGDPVASSTVLIVGESEQIDPKTNAPVLDKTGQPTLQMYICSASLIAEDMVVSAAHCVAENTQYPTNPTQMLVIFSTTLPLVNGNQLNLNDPAVHRVSGFKYDPEWKGAINGAVSGTDAHDISVIHFEGAVPQGYSPATLLDPSVKLSAGENVLLAGYGIDTISDKTGSTAGTLREVDVSIRGLSGKTEVVVDESHQKGMCSGDSGGPAFLTMNGVNYLWGITSRSDQNCAIEGIYTRIDSYLDFISQSEDALRSSN